MPLFFSNKMNHTCPKTPQAVLLLTLLATQFHIRINIPPTGTLYFIYNSFIDFLSVPLSFFESFAFFLHFFLSFFFLSFFFSFFFSFLFFYCFLIIQFQANKKTNSKYSLFYPPYWIGLEAGVDVGIMLTGAC